SLFICGCKPLTVFRNLLGLLFHRNGLNTLRKPLIVPKAIRFPSLRTPFIICFASLALFLASFFPKLLLRFDIGSPCSAVYLLRTFVKTVFFSTLFFIDRLPVP